MEGARPDIGLTGFLRVGKGSQDFLKEDGG